MATAKGPTFAPPKLFSGADLAQYYALQRMLNAAPLPGGQPRAFYLVPRSAPGVVPTRQALIGAVPFRPGMAVQAGSYDFVSGTTRDAMSAGITEADRSYDNSMANSTAAIALAQRAAEKAGRRANRNKLSLWKVMRTVVGVGVSVMATSLIGPVLAFGGAVATLGMLGRNMYQRHRSAQEYNNHSHSVNMLHGGQRAAANAARGAAYRQFMTDQTRYVDQMTLQPGQSQNQGHRVGSPFLSNLTYGHGQRPYESAQQYLADMKRHAATVNEPFLNGVTADATFLDSSGRPVTLADADRGALRGDLAEALFLSPNRRDNWNSLLSSEPGGGTLVMPGSGWSVKLGASGQLAIGSVAAIPGWTPTP
jgi:hypothetical protein